MVQGFWGHKIGMTQIFANGKSIPVTAVRSARWFIIGTKTVECDGYNALVVACLKDKHQELAFSHDWIKKPKTYFAHVREVKVDGSLDDFTVGNELQTSMACTDGDYVDVVGVSKGRGFAGVVRRYNFGGPPASHGSMMGKRPGSIGFLTACGMVIKGKKMPGHAGNRRCTVKGLQVVKSDVENNTVVLIKGSIPGKAGSLVFVRKMQK